MTESEQQNQCDGCRRGLPIENGLHVVPDAKGYYERCYMLCSRKRYENEEKEDATQTS